MAMIVANFTRRRVGGIASRNGDAPLQARMRELEGKLRRGMSANGIRAASAGEIVQSITSFALYGFPESHAASFALIAYASAYLKCHYLAAFTAALLNNQPMGFYSPATMVKDAQLHGLRVKPIDVLRSDWLCTLEPDEPGNASFRFAARVALRRGLRQEVAEAFDRGKKQRAFKSIQISRCAYPSCAKAISRCWQDRCAELAGRRSIAAMRSGRWSMLAAPRVLC